MDRKQMTPRLQLQVIERALAEMKRAIERVTPGQVLRVTVSHETE